MKPDIHNSKFVQELEKEKVSFQVQPGYMSKGEQFWATYSDPTDDPAGYVVVPIWPFRPSGMRPVADPVDWWKRTWKGGQYHSGPIDVRVGLAGVGVPIRVRSEAYARHLCEPKLDPTTMQMVQLAEWPERMRITSIAPVYRKNTRFLNEKRWK